MRYKDTNGICVFIADFNGFMQLCEYTSASSTIPCYFVKSCTFLVANSELYETEFDLYLCVFCPVIINLISTALGIGKLEESILLTTIPFASALAPTMRSSNYYPIVKRVLCSVIATDRMRIGSLLFQNIFGYLEQEFLQSLLGKQADSANIVTATYL